MPCKPSVLPSLCGHGLLFAYPVAQIEGWFSPHSPFAFVSSVLVLFIPVLFMTAQWDYILSHWKEIFPLIISLLPKSRGSYINLITQRMFEQGGGLRMWGTFLSLSVKHATCTIQILHLSLYDHSPLPFERHSHLSIVLLLLAFNTVARTILELGKRINNVPEMCLGDTRTAKKKNLWQ